MLEAVYHKGLIQFENNSVVCSVFDLNLLF